MVRDTKISQICSPLILVFRLDSQNTIFKSEVCLFFQCLVFRVFLFLFLCPRLVSFIYSYTYLNPSPSFDKGGDGVVKISAKNGGGLNFSNEKGRVGKIVK